MYAVTVTFDIQPDHSDAFLALMIDNARTSVRDEPGCLQFDVCRNPGAHTVFLYEIYTDRAAFDAHLASTHFRSFDEEVANMVRNKIVHAFDEVIR